MGKKIFKIPAWDQGVMSNLSPRDIPDDALSYSENVDSRIRGTIKGRRGDSDIRSGFEYRVLGNISQGDNLLIGQEPDTDFRVYNIDTDITERLIPISTNYFAYTAAPTGGAVYFGMSESFRDGDSNTGRPIWIGRKDNYQFPADTGATLAADVELDDTTISVDDASLLFDNTFIVISPGTTRQEALHITAVDTVSNTITVDRGAIFTAQSIHVTGESIYVLRFGTTGYHGYQARAKNDADVIERGTVTEGAAGGGSFFSTDKTYYYAYSLVYDGFQESTLSETGRLDPYTPSSNAATLDFNLNIDFNNDNDFSRRITHINLYRAESPASSNRPYDNYRLVESFNLEDPIWATPSDNASENWSYKTPVSDNGQAGATYGNNSGLPETLDHVDVRYKLAKTYSGYLFAGNCRVKGVGHADRYVYRSKPYAYSVIDWSNDYAILPENPVALEGYNGRMYAFSNSSIYRINPSTMTLEDSYRGAGAFNENMAIATNYGMFHADDNNIYVNDGRTSVPIGTPVQTVQFGDSNYGWRDIQKTDVASENYAIMTFDNENKRLLVFGTVDGQENVCWAYDVEYQEWHLYTGYSNVPSTFAYGVDGTLYGSFGNTTDGFELRSIATSGTRIDWKIVTKDFDLGSDSGDFWAYDLQGFGNGNFDIKYLTDGSDTVNDEGTVSEDGLRKTTVNPGNKKMKSIAVQVESNQPTDELDNLTVQYRPQLIQE